jgi:ATP-binding cassette subfamily C (CFTR/MRP) protein 1
VWLKHWSEANGDSGGNEHVGKYIGVYFAFGFGYSLLILVQTLLLWIFCSIEVGLSQNVVLHSS